MATSEDITDSVNANNDSGKVDQDMHPTPRRWGGMLGISLLAIVLVVAAIIGIQLLTIIYALLFPPDAPLPADVVEISHENLAYGVDKWLYGTSMDGCALVEFYLTHGGECVVAPGVCGTSGFENVSPGQQSIATCDGQVGFSIFSMHWSANIASGYSIEPITRFNLEQEISWFSTPSEPTDSE